MNDHSQKYFVVTGAAGFIGSFLARRLLETQLVHPKHLLLVDFEQAYRDRPCTKWIRENFNLVCLNPEDFENSMRQGGLSSKVAGVFHMGASSSTEEMRLDFLKKWNVEYSKTVWNFCSQESIPLVYASSAATYGDGTQGFSDSELDFQKLKPLNPYGQSKLEFDIWAQNQSQSGVSPKRWAGLRFFNVYGPGESHKGSQASVVVHAQKQIQETGKLKLFQSHRQGIADGQQKRDFVYVGDVASVCEFFMMGPAKMSGVFNVGTGQAQTFESLGLECFRAMGLKPNIEYIPTPEKLRPHYQYFTQADVSRLRMAGFEKEFFDLKQGVAKTLSQYY